MIRKKISEVLKGGLFTDGDWINSKDQDPDGEIRLIQLADIGDGVFINKSSRYINNATAKRLKCTFLKKGDVLVARMPDPLGRSCIFPLEGYQKYITAVDVCILRPDEEKVSNSYLSHMINSPFNRSEIERQSTGTTRKRITRKRLGNLEIPFPPLKTQEHIAGILDDAAALRDKTAQLLEEYDLLAQSIFLEMFGDPAINQKGWEMKKFDDVGEIARGKSQHRPRNAPELLGGIYPLIQTGDIANSDGYIREYKSTYSEIGLAQSRLWPAGTLCITIPANIANTGILTMDACFPDSVVGFIPNEQTNNEFTQYWMSFLQKIIEANAPHVAQKNINLRILKELDFFCPPIELQNEFAEKIALIEQQKELVRQELKECEDLFNCLLQK